MTKHKKKHQRSCWLLTESTGSVFLKALKQRCKSLLRRPNRHRIASQSVYATSSWVALKRNVLGMWRKTLETYETRTLADGEYRVNKNLPHRPIKFDPEDIVHAKRTDVGWHCEVPQCEATFPGTLAIDIHLQSHGTIIKWYCGDSSCYTGVERAFNDRASFELHVATEHMGSEYSTKAGRRVPKDDVLFTTLLKLLKFKHLPLDQLAGKNEITKAPTASIEKEVDVKRRQESESDSDDEMRQELRAWGQVC
ncbi:hypothetical protein Z517_09869 [Fonsecaea pedrosoi CBS 271.37]|uniref:C2H2-type domain-containing protein n=1 Tax=Fonsecaea pedrosoi CBS 271.37 TaxID=1442368 RepID=A0A0D2G9P8_9EURO|nr:uncharacterized protein Z517_09869 [Fonsecaea pedrosoi CBS 271.37]KIW77423.1 hypothetical protein Z517_09869 [Fonsecaea pedrosoi CBS 271.37]